MGCNQSRVIPKKKTFGEKILKIDLYDTAPCCHQCKLSFPSKRELYRHKTSYNSYNIYNYPGEDNKKCCTEASKIHTFYPLSSWSYYKRSLLKFKSEDKDIVNTLKSQYDKENSVNNVCK